MISPNQTTSYHEQNRQRIRKALLSLFFIFFALFSFSTISFAKGTQLFVVDSGVAEYESMLRDLPEGTATLLLNRESDALSQIALALSNSRPVDEIHLVSHAQAGALSLAGEKIDIHMLRQQQSTLDTIRRHLSESADIYLYGCDLAANEAGKDFVKALAQKTRANVAASSNKTGALGDWNLEYQVGQAGQPMLLSKTFQSNYKHTLSHFRGGSISWQAAALDGDGIKNDVEVTVKTAWRYNSSNTPSLTASPALAFTRTSDVTDYINGTSAGADYALKTTTFTARNLDSNTDYLVWFGSCCRIGGLTNNASGRWKIQTNIYMKDGNLAPKIDLPIIYEVPQLESDGVTTLTNYSFNISATDPNADKIRFRLANTDELGSQTSYTNPVGFSIDANTGVVTWTNSGNMAAGLYSAGIVVEDLDANLNVKSKSHVDFILELVNKAAVAYTPSANIPVSRNIIVEKGSSYSFAIIGSAVNVSSLGSLQNTLTETSEGNFTFAPGAVNSGLSSGTYPITFEINDTTGSSAKSYLILNFIVPNPGAPKIDNIEGDYSIYSSSTNQLVDVSLDAVVSDMDTGGNPLNHMNNGYIRFNVTFVDGQYETLDIKSDGDSTGQIRRTGYEVFYEGSKIGDIDSFEDGIGRALRINFGTASLAAVQALVRNLNYTDTFLLRAAGLRNLSLFIQDSDGLNRNYSVYVDVQDHPDKPANGGPVEVNNSLNLSNGDSKVISTENLTFVDPDDAASNITLTVSNVMQGWFALTTNIGIAVSSFTQAQVNAGQVQFVHNGSGIAPTYSVSAFDGVNSTMVSAAAISFTGASSDGISLFENRVGVMVVPNNVTGSPSYAITGAAADNALFSVGASSGSLAFNNAPDFEVPADNNQDNVFDVEVTVSGSTSGTDVRSITVTLLDINEAPSITGTPITSVTEGGTYSFASSATDPENDSLTYSITNKPSWASFNTSTGELSGSTSYTDAGSYSNISISVSDGTASDSLTSFTIMVSNNNRQPTLSGIPATSVIEGNAYSFIPIGTDDDSNDTLTYSIINKPVWANFDTSTGALTGNPGNADTGVYNNIQISLTDGSGGSASLTAFNISVGPLNRAPAISGTPVTNGTENGAYSFLPNSNDADGDVLSFSITNKPSWASFNTSTGELSGTPGFSGAATYSNIGISVSDGTASDSLTPFTITVSNTNRAPAISGTPVTNGTENGAYSFLPNSNDADGDVLSFSITNKPSWASFNTSTGELSGTPGFSGAATYSNIGISVSDGVANASLAVFNITINDKNRAPQADTQSVDVVQNVAQTITLTGSDSDLDSLTFVLSTTPVYGILSGTGANRIYTPNEGYTGADSFSFKTNDTELDSPDTTINIMVWSDLDSDGIPDRTDPDDDGDGISDIDEGTGDSDNDGTPDYKDSDSDNDGISDADEGTGDSDGDGIPDYRDTDADGDGIADIDEGAGDSDGDNIPDYMDSSLDEDQDGIPDIIEGTADSDGDGIPNFRDPDSDNDGINDGDEARISGLDSDNDGIDNSFDVDITGGNDSNGDGIDDNISLIDSDNDGVVDIYDRDSDNDGIPDVIEGSGSDQDNDGTPDYLDLDSDNDGISDSVEAGISSMDVDGDGIDDRFDVDFSGGLDQNNDGIDDMVQLPDTDGDGVADVYDLDSDNDGIFDSREAGLNDDNNDGIVDDIGRVENTLLDRDNDGTPDYRDLDSDNDGINDIDATAARVLDRDGDGQIDLTVDNDGDGIDDSLDGQSDQVGSNGDGDNDGIPPLLDKDEDADGIPDAIEGNGDTDNDGVVDYLDRDSDNDGLSDAYETDRPRPLGRDTDQDGIDDAYDVTATGGVDSNSDGIDDRFEEVDTDNDGLPDYIDPDSDNDGIPDAEEQLGVALLGIDSDSDGIDDAVDVDFTGGVDINNDGIDDRMLRTIDMDNDGLPDYRDTDSDGDGVPDSKENGDFNLDGIIDRLQKDEGVSTGVSAGSTGLYMLLGLGCLVLVRLRRHKGMLAVCAVALSMNSQAEEGSLCEWGEAYKQSQCWYAGAGLGLSQLDPKPFGSSNWRVDENSDRTIAAFVGLRIKEHYFAEFSYADLGAATLSNLNPAISEKPTVDYTIFGLSAGYWLRGGKVNWNAYLKAGIQRLESTTSVYASQENANLLTLGIGIDKRISGPWFARLGFDYYSADAQSMGISIARYFGNSKQVMARQKTAPIAVETEEVIPMVIAAQTQIVAAIINKDSDNDGVLNAQDKCPNSKIQVKVGATGCAVFDAIELVIQFDSSSVLVNDEGMEKLKAVAAQIQQYGDEVAISLEGHADNSGKQALNNTLAKARAYFVGDILKEHTGLSTQHFNINSYGESKPVADNQTKIGRSKNRRVTILIMPRR